MSYLFKLLHSISNNGISKRRFYCGIIAIYDSSALSPRTEEVTASDLSGFLALLTQRVCSLHLIQGGTLPQAAIFEVVENVVHADCDNVVVSLLSDGSIRVCDSGRGIRNKEKAVQPGYSTADNTLRKYIKGVGSGLAIASEILHQAGGFLSLDDNLGGGTCVQIYAPQVASTIDLGHATPNQLEGGNSADGELNKDTGVTVMWQALTPRQQEILTVLHEKGVLGPSKVAEHIGTSPSSAYRDMVSLTNQGLVEVTDGGKRKLSVSAVALFTK